MKRLSLFICIAGLSGLMLAGCAAKGNTEVTATPEAQVSVEADASENIEVSEDTENIETEEIAELPLEPGDYDVSFDTDSSMFHLNETCNGRAKLTVTDSEMVIHIPLTSKNIVNLYLGLAEDAQAEGAELIEPVAEEVTYDDGLTEEVNAFDVKVPYLDDEFDLALIGKKGVWYDHKVSVSDPKPYGEGNEDTAAESAALDVAEGDYTIEVSLEGGSGKAKIDSPTAISKTDEGMIATITWSSPHYDYMIVDDVKYEPINTEGNSVFEIPVSKLDEPITVIADTTAMSTPHEIEYVLVFDSASMK